MGPAVAILVQDPLAVLCLENWQYIPCSSHPLKGIIFMIAPDYNKALHKKCKKLIILQPCVNKSLMNLRIFSGVILEPERHQLLWGGPQAMEVVLQFRQSTSSFGPQGLGRQARKCQGRPEGVVHSGSHQRPCYSRQIRRLKRSCH